MFSLGRFGEAARASAKLTQLRPRDAGAHFNLGMALLSNNRPEEAVSVLQTAIRLDSKQAKHHHALGRALSVTNRKPEAAAAMIKATELDPEDVASLLALSAILIETGELNAAVGAALTAIQKQPENGRAHGNLASALHELGKTAEALPPARACVRLSPGNAGAFATLGAILYTLGHHAEALERSRQALRITPSLYQARMNEALALEALGQLEEAEIAGRAAIELAPADNPDTRHNLAAMLLASGRLGDETWALYDCRLRLNANLRRLADKPRWQGEDIAGKTILIHCEQGFGDTIQFLRYAPMVTALGARVILVVQPELHSLLKDLPGVHAVIPAGTDMPPHDAFCPLLSVPRAFGTTLDTIPSGAAYIQPPADRIAQWQLPDAPGLKVGLVWAGSTVFVHDTARSVAPELLAPLATVPGVEFHSLQKPVRDIDSLPVIDRMAEAKDFADTAAIIAGLDLVISVDSGVAHLAAAMGKEVWLLSRFVGCWRWLRNRADSPWYPTMRVFGQSAPNDWTGVIDRVRIALAERVGQPMPHQPAATVRQPVPNALAGLCLPADAPRTIVAIVGDNENGTLRTVSQDFMGLLPAHGFDPHVIELSDPIWLDRLGSLLQNGVLFAWGAAGAGARLPHPEGLLWETLRVPFISVLADSPCWMPANHHVPSRYIANGYVYRDWLTMQRRLIQSPQISSLLPHGVLPNPDRDTVPWSRRRNRMVFVKTGCDPAQHEAEWAALPARFRTVVAESATACLKQPVGDISETVLRCMAAHDLYVEKRPDILFALMRHVDVYVRDVRSSNLVTALLDLPVDILGRGWDHLAAKGGRAEFHAPVDASALPGIYADTQFLLNTMPNVSAGTHERVAAGFDAKCCVVTNENAEMKARFSALPSYFGIDTEAANLPDRLAALFHDTHCYDDDLEPAVEIARTEFSPEGFMRGLIDLALEMRSAASFAAFGY